MKNSTSCAQSNGCVIEACTVYNESNNRQLQKSTHGKIMILDGDSVCIYELYSKRINVTSLSVINRCSTFFTGQMFKYSISTS